MSFSMQNRCAECGAPVPADGSCRDNFHNLLLLEGEIPGVPGSIAHFYVVATYGLQHPDSMNYTAEALAGLRATLSDALDGRLPIDSLRQRVRSKTNGSMRVTRREGDGPVPWPRGDWPMTVADICTVETYGEYETYDEFSARLLRWATSVRDTLNARFPAPGR